MQPLSLTLSYHFIYYRLSNSQRENRIFFFCVWALWRGSLSPSVWLIVRWFEWYLSLYCSEDRWRRWGAEWWRHERNKQWNVWFRVQLRTLVFARGCNKSWESFIKKKNHLHGEFSYWMSCESTVICEDDKTKFILENVYRFESQIFPWSSKRVRISENDFKAILKQLVEVWRIKE